MVFQNATHPPRQPNTKSPSYRVTPVAAFIVLALAQLRLEAMNDVLALMMRSRVDIDRQTGAIDVEKGVGRKDVAPNLQTMCHMLRSP